MRRFGRLIILLTSLGLVFSTDSSIAQDSTKAPMQTIFGGKNVKTKINYLGLYIAPELQYGQLGGSFTPMGGMSLMMQVNKKWGIGMTGFSSRGSSSDTSKIGGHFGGLKLEYTPKPDARFHVSFPLMLGMGQTGGSRFGNESGIGYGKHHGGYDRDRSVYNYDGTVRSEYAVIQPGVSLEGNLFRYAKVFVGANYRFAFNSTGYSSDMQGLSANAGLKIGVFDYALKGKKIKKSKKQASLKE